MVLDVGIMLVGDKKLIVLVELEDFSIYCVIILEDYDFMVIEVFLMLWVDGDIYDIGN